MSLLSKIKDNVVRVGLFRLLALSKVNIFVKRRLSSHFPSKIWSIAQANSVIKVVKVASWMALFNTSRLTKVLTLKQAIPTKLMMANAVSAEKILALLIRYVFSVFCEGIFL